MTDSNNRCSAGSRAPWRTKRVISHAEAREVATRLINSHFNKEPHARVGIPARPDYDDDILIVSYIKQQQEKEESADPAQAVGMREALEPLAKYEMIAVGFNGCFSKEDLKECTWVAGFKGPQPEFRHFQNARDALALSRPHHSSPSASSPAEAAPSQRPPE
jgi:hypothetical protein